MTDEELIARLREGATWDDDISAADRIEGLIKSEADAVEEAHAVGAEREAWKCRAEASEAKVAKLVEALREIATEASVPVHTWKNGINFRKLYLGWRKIAMKRIDIARAALHAFNDGEKT